MSVIKTKRQINTSVIGDDRVVLQQFQRLVFGYAGYDSVLLDSHEILPGENYSSYVANFVGGYPHALSEYSDANIRFSYYEMNYKNTEFMFPFFIEKKSFTTIVLNFYSQSNFENTLNTMKTLKEFNNEEIPGVIIVCLYNHHLLQHDVVVDKLTSVFKSTYKSSILAIPIANTKNEIESYFLELFQSGSKKKSIYQVSQDNYMALEVALLDIIVDENRHHISYDEFMNICHNITDNFDELYTQSIKSKLIYHLKNIETLSNEILICTDSLFSLIAIFGNLPEGEYLVTESFLRDKLADYFVNILIFYETIYPVSKDGILFYHIPFLKSEKTPNEEAEELLSRLLPVPPLLYHQYERFYPLGRLLPNLVFRLSSEILNIPNIEIVDIWALGIIFRLNGEIGILLYDSANFTLTTVVQHPESERETYIRDPLSLLFAVTSRIQTVLHSFYDLEVPVQIKCTHCLMRRMHDLNPVVYQYNDLVKSYLETNQRELSCSGVPFSLDLLAPDIVFTYSNTFRQVEVLKSLGEGAFGDVYYGEMGDVEVAVKQLKVDFTDSAETLSHFREFSNEVYLMSSLNTEYVTQLFGISVNPLCIIMEYVSMGSLLDILENKSKYPDEFLDNYIRTKFCYDIARGIKYLHSLEPPIIHRDIRSPNIFIDSLDPTVEVNAKVGDFGLSIQTRQHNREYLTTWQWLPPEVINPTGCHYSISCDIYSFGMVMWEIETRKLPFSDMEQYIEVREEILSDDQVNDPSFINSLKESGWRFSGDPFIAKMELFDKHEIVSAILENGLRPTIPENSILRGDLMTSCWEKNYLNRSSIDSLVDELNKELSIFDKQPRESKAIRKVNPEFLMKVKSSILNSVDTVKLEHSISCTKKFGDYSFSGYKNGYLEMVDPEGQHHHIIEEEGNPILNLVNSNNTIWVHSFGLLRVFDMRTLELTKTIPGAIKSLCSMKLPKSNESVVIVGYQLGEIKVYKSFDRYQSEDTILTLPSAPISMCSTVTVQGWYVWISREDRIVNVIDCHGELYFEWETPGPLYNMSCDKTSVFGNVHSTIYFYSNLIPSLNSMMWKKGSSKYSLRAVQLTPEGIRFYSKIMGKSEKGKISLDEIDSITSSKEPENLPEGSGFTIITKSRKKHIFCAETKDEKHTWILTLRKLLLSIQIADEKEYEWIGNPPLYILDTGHFSDLKGVRMIQNEQHKDCWTYTSNSILIYDMKTLTCLEEINMPGYITEIKQIGPNLIATADDKKNLKTWEYCV